MVTIKTFSTRPEAAMTQQLLEQNGIYAVVFAPDAGGMYPQFNAAQGVELKVLEADTERATLFLQKLEPTESEPSQGAEE
jgi:hypothetical protein